MWSTASSNSRSRSASRQGELLREVRKEADRVGARIDHEVERAALTGEVEGAVGVERRRGDGQDTRQDGARRHDPFASGSPTDSAEDSMPPIADAPAGGIGAVGASAAGSVAP